MENVIDLLLTISLEGILWILRFLIGACIFSFLNVVIYRLPRGESVVRGRSHCTHCGRRLGAAEMIPCVSYLALGRKCKGCGEPISSRYFWMELLGGGVFCLCCGWFGAGDQGLITWEGLIVFGFLAVLAAVGRIDWETQIIYDRFHVLILVLGLLALWVMPQVTLRERLLGGVVIALPMLVLALLIPGAFGGGDIKLVAVSGFFLGVKAAVAGVFLGFILGGIYAMAMLARKKLGRKDVFAFGPFLALGLGLAAFVGNQAADWYLGWITFA